MGLSEAINESEIDLFRAMNLAGTNFALDSLMVFFTILGISFVIVLVCVPLWFQGKKTAAVDSVMLVLVTTVVVEALKLAVDRPRPDLELDDVNTLVSATGASFPSGHAARAFAVACLTCIVEPRRYWFPALFLASLISMSRIYLGVHWPTDVLAGLILGVIIAIGFNELAKRSKSYSSLRGRFIAVLSRR